MILSFTQNPRAMKQLVVPAFNRSSGAQERSSPPAAREGRPVNLMALLLHSRTDE
jgi:hypothetical protein